MTSQTLTAPRPVRAPLRRFLNEYGHECVVALTIIVLLVGVGLYNPRFISARNLSSIFSGNAYVAIAAIGMTLLIVALVGLAKYAETREMYKLLWMPVLLALIAAFFSNQSFHLNPLK